MSELTPLLDSQNTQQNYIEAIAPSVIAVISFLCLFQFFSKILQLSTSSWKFLLPIVTNVITEKYLLMVIINPVILFFLFRLIIIKQDIIKSYIYAFGICITSNFIAFVLITSFIKSSRDSQFCGCLSAIIPLSVLLYYTNNNSKIQIFQNISLNPQEIIFLIGIWSVLCFRLPPFNFLSALISFFLSKAVLEYQKDLFVDQNMNRLSFEKILTVKKQEIMPKQPSVIEKMVIPQDGALSKEDQDRRQRALRAIEEKIEAMQK